MTSKQNSQDKVFVFPTLRQLEGTFEGGNRFFWPHPFAWTTPTPSGLLQAQRANLCALFSFLKETLELLNTIFGEVGGWSAFYHWAF